MSDKVMDTTLIDEKRQKRLDACKQYYEFKKNDAEYQRKLKEGERQRYELRKQNPEWVAKKYEYDREKRKQHKEIQHIYYQANVEKFNERCRRYYQNKCLTDPTYRDKMNEQKRSNTKQEE